MNKILAILIFTLLNIASNGQTVKAVKLVDSLLKPGTLKAAITVYDFSKDIKKLQEKALNSLKSNPQWADKYIVIQVQKSAVDIPEYLDAYGLTKSEFDKMIAGFRNKKQPTFSDTTVMTIKKVKGIIVFHSSKKMSLFNHLSIDTKKSIILFDNLTPTKELEIKGKFYAPILHGIESHSSVKMNAIKNQTGTSHFGFAIGVNEGDISRPTMTLIYGNEVNDTRFTSITIL